MIHTFINHQNLDFPHIYSFNANANAIGSMQINLLLINVQKLYETSMCLVCHKENVYVIQPNVDHKRILFFFHFKFIQNRNAFVFRSKKKKNCVFAFNFVL